VLADLELAEGVEPTLEWAVSLVDAYLSGQIGPKELAQLSQNPHLYFVRKEEEDDAYSCDKNMICLFATSIWSISLDISQGDYDPRAIEADVRWWKSRLERGQDWWLTEVESGRWPPNDDSPVVDAAV
jgi:hypothetical protein